MENEKSNIDSTKFYSWEDKNRIRANQRYHAMVQQNCQIKKAESLLAHLASQWGFNTPIPASEFEKLNFPYLVATSGTTKYSQYALVVGRYAYSFYDNFTFKIFKHE
jgi:hypothetical protein